MRKGSNQDKLARRFDTNHNANDNCNEDYKKLIDSLSHSVFRAEIQILITLVMSYIKS